MQKETRKDAIDKCKSKIPAGLWGLFSEPPLLPGEDPNLFWSFLEETIEERKPETASDWIAVNDLVTKVWEERLLKQASHALVRGGMIQRLGDCLAAAEEPGPEGELLYTQDQVVKSRQKRAEIAQGWREDYAKGRTAIAPLLVRLGMTEPELYARVFAGNSEVLQTFERMIAARERGRRKLRKEDERRRRWQERQENETKQERRTNGKRKAAQGQP